MAQANQSDRCFSFQSDFLIVRVAKFVEKLGTMFRSSQLRGELGNHIAYFEAKFPTLATPNFATSHLRVNICGSYVIYLQSDGTYM